MRGCRSDWLEAQRAVGQGRSPGKVGFPTKWIRNAAYPDDHDTNHDAGFDYPDLLWRVLIGRIVLDGLRRFKVWDGRLLQSRTIGTIQNAPVTTLDTTRWIYRPAGIHNPLILLVRPAGLEPATF